MSQDIGPEVTAGRSAPRREVLQRAREKAMALEDHYVALLANDAACLKRATALRTELDASLAALSATESPQPAKLEASDYPELLRAAEGIPELIDFTGQLSVDN
jgi:hypothetical protein